MNHETLCQLFKELSDRVAALESGATATHSAAIADLDARLAALEAIVGTPEHGSDATASASASTTAPTT